MCVSGQLDIFVEGEYLLFGGFLIHRGTHELADNAVCVSAFGLEICCSRGHSLLGLLGASGASGGAGNGLTGGNSGDSRNLLHSVLYFLDVVSVLSSLLSDRG